MTLFYMRLERSPVKAVYNFSYRIWILLDVCSRFHLETAVKRVKLKTKQNFQPKQPKTASSRQIKQDKNFTPKPLFFMFVFILCFHLLFVFLSLNVPSQILTRT
ncbi:hypothetical protein DRO59_03880 [Candidatus Bathyarchaeota archaeon]|nr:MAG: hypothetical protein DRO59_03880 [Candidatus Bathyarchaeota archaeon]